MQAVYRAFERNAALLLASEQWADGYAKAPLQHGKLIRETARLERKLLVFFKQQATTAPRFINWAAYAMAVQEVKASKIDAYDVNVIVTEGAGNDNGDFINVILDPVIAATTLGIAAGQSTYSVPIDLAAADDTAQRLAKKQIGSLVGKIINPDGSIVDNPNPDYLISNTTRKKIQESINTSIMLGENVEAATKRLRSVIRDPKRAAMIAQQEMANAYTTGLHAYGAGSGAIGKEWQDNGAIDICRTNTLAGPIPFDKAYPSGNMHPTAHIGCKCYERLYYPNDLKNNPKLFDTPWPDIPTATPKATPKPKPVAAKPKPAELPTVASFTKGSQTVDFALKTTEAKVISGNNIVMSTAPAPGKTRWPKSTHGLYAQRGTDYKGMHIRDPLDPEAKQTFYHELGHAIDAHLEPVGTITRRYHGGTSTALSERLAKAHQLDRLAIYKQRITDQYKDVLDSQQIDTMLNGGRVTYQKTVRGQQVNYIGRIPTKYRTYATSPSEVFAHGYGYYRTNPDLLRAIAPNLFSIYEELK